MVSIIDLNIISRILEEHFKAFKVDTAGHFFFRLHWKFACATTAVPHCSCGGREHADLFSIPAKWEAADLCFKGINANAHEKIY